MSEFEMAGQKWKFEADLEVWKDGKWEYVGYDDLIKLTHTDTEWIVVFEDGYQGDYFAAGKREDGKWLFIQGSFGSCSYCDWLEGLADLEDAKKIINYHLNDIIIKNSKEDIVAYIKDTKNNAYWAEDVIDELIEKLTLADKKTGEGK
jgi:hypothetical protein